MKQKPKGLILDMPGLGKVHIGSKMYPMSRRKEVYVFTNEDMIHPYQNERLASLVEQKRHLFGAGRCYTTAGNLRDLAASIGLPMHVFSGWLFIGSAPIHHAWGVLEEDGHTYIFDLTFNVPYARWVESQPKELYGVPVWREKALAMEQQFDRQPIPSSTIFGSIPADIRAVYVGSPDTPEEAAQRWIDLIQKFPNHPTLTPAVLRGMARRLREARQDLKGVAGPFARTKPQPT